MLNCHSKANYSPDKFIAYTVQLVGMNIVFTKNNKGWVLIAIYNFINKSGS